jgi:hypothetical protein
MGIHEGGLAAHESDVVECEVFQNALALHVDDFALVMHEVVDGQILFQRVVDTVEAALLEAGKIERGFAQRLAGNGAGVDAASAHMLDALDNGNAFAEIGSLRAAFFARGATANHDEIELVVRSHKSPRESVTPKPAKCNAVESGRIVQDARRSLVTHRKRSSPSFLFPFALTERFVLFKIQEEKRNPEALSTALPYTARRMAREAAGGVCPR